MAPMNKACKPNHFLGYQDEGGIKKITAPPVDAKNCKYVLYNIDRPQKDQEGDTNPVFPKKPRYPRVIKRMIEQLDTFDDSIGQRQYFLVRLLLRDSGKFFDVVIRKMDAYLLAVIKDGIIYEYTRKNCPRRFKNSISLGTSEGYSCLNGLELSYIMFCWSVETIVYNDLDVRRCNWGTPLTIITATLCEGLRFNPLYVGCSHIMRPDGKLKGLKIIGPWPNVFRNWSKMSKLKSMPTDYDLSCVPKIKKLDSLTLKLLLKEKENEDKYVKRCRLCFAHHWIKWPLRRSFDIGFDKKKGEWVPTAQSTGKARRAGDKVRKVGRRGGICAKPKRQVANVAANFGMSLYVGLMECPCLHEVFQLPIAFDYRHESVCTFGEGVEEVYLDLLDSYKKTTDSVINLNEGLAEKNPAIMEDGDAAQRSTSIGAFKNSSLGVEELLQSSEMQSRFGYDHPGGYERDMGGRFGYHDDSPRGRFTGRSSGGYQGGPDWDSGRGVYNGHANTSRIDPFRDKLVQRSGAASIKKEFEAINQLTLGSLNHPGLIALEGCSISEAYQLLNNRWEAVMRAYEDPSTDLSEKPVMYSGSGGAEVEGSSHQIDFLSELRRAMNHSA